ncbi:CPBP family intramembrane glutamic endopeptidase [Enterococcus avium]|jgi:membrane protease YdiL (CAAX protease family)|uniref:CPBP family intramembrane glutamic endopeptidase n=1 Tax=Enterococcus avium TaxID=33945 RepID=UPI00159D3155|nr:type II CAAX endopeptidase family protein [Enterococcus avium]NVN78949.1 CPBP family intramembrane metalloprotease [Enterococcus avium]
MKKEYFLKGLAVVIALFGFVLGMISNNAVAGLFPASMLLVSALVSTVVHISICLLFFYFASRVEKKTIRNYGMSWNKGDGRQLIYGLLAGIGVFLLITGTLYLPGLYQLKTGNQNLYKLLVNFVIFVAVGTSEELFFRGFIQHRLLKFGPIIALLGSGLLFALVHALNPNVSLLALVNVFLAGCFFGVLMYKTGSLLTAIGAHITWNWVQGSLLGIPVSGTTESGYFRTIIHGDNPLLTGGQFGAEAALSTTIVLAVLTLVLLLYLYKTKQINSIV